MLRLLKRFGTVGMSCLMIGCAPVTKEVISDYCMASTYIRLSDGAIASLDADDKRQIKVHNATFYCLCQAPEGSEACLHSLFGE